MKKNTRLSRILFMEERYNEVTRILSKLDEAVADYEKIKTDINILEEYMTSGQWKKDFEADEAEKIPENIQRGVLSEDGLYNLLEDADEIIAHAKEVLCKDDSEK